MNKQYFKGLQKTNKYNWENQLFLKKRVLKTFRNLVKTFFNKEIHSDQFLLDLGSSGGALVQVAKDEGLKSLGLDVDQINLEKDKIDLNDKTCDIISAVSLIEHLQNPENLLSEVKRLLKSNGFFIIVTPDWSFNMKHFFDDPTHVHPYTKKSLNFLLKSNGFKNIKIVPWLVCKPSWMWKIPFSFFVARFMPFRGNNEWAPEMLKGRSKTLLAICTR